jgi:hypothetical protein
MAQKRKGGSGHQFGGAETRSFRMGFGGLRIPA